MTSRLLRLLPGLLAVGLVVAPDATSLGGDERISFQEQIKPLLSNKCVLCHGPDPEQRQADLRLDRFEDATADRGGYAAIVPGKPDESELIARITSDDEYMVMPPADTGKTLSDSEKQLLRRWVTEGADFEPHWSYVAPQRPPLPQVRDESWPQNGIDHFVAARLDEKGLKPAPRADRRTLIRRVTLALTGLPPSPEDVEAFVNDTQPHAYERLVDRLLSDVAYGERWASFWLDLARYADSAGYADDPTRTIWAYRDWVIRAFNDNMPFDQFTIEQIAGDLLENPTQDQLIATAFHRNTMTNSEGGTDDEEFRNAAVVDRTNTTMEVWMGTTMACAQCHTHKYDPITQEEYFRFFAIFNSTADSDQKDESPLLPIYTEEQREKLDRLEQQLAKAKAQLSVANPKFAAALTRWEKAVAAEEVPNVLSGRTVRVEIPEREEFLSLAEVQVFSAGENVAPSGTARQSSTTVGEAERAIDGNTDGNYARARSITHTKKERGPWWEVDLGREQPIERIVLWNRTDNGLGKRLRDFRVSIRDGAGSIVWSRDVKEPPETSVEFSTEAVPAEVRQILEIPRNKRSGTQQEQVAAAFLVSSGQFEPLRRRVATLETQVDRAAKPVTTVPVMRELPEEERRETRVQIRGNFLDTAQQVEPGVPGVWHELPSDSPPDRMALARWLVSRDNPLTARVFVNRVWEKLFGIGLVGTSEEFGSQGELPSHPELLDWLAVEFVESGWNVKHLMRLMVTSATYQQQSEADAELVREDPDNRLLARGPRFRLAAEMIRDQALEVGGLLSPRLFGPPVQPPRPNLGLKAAFGSSTDWTDSTGEDRYRRALYTEWRRSMPYPSMLTFDMPDREVCAVSRSRTNTPLQALVTLNDPVYFEAAQALARRMVLERPEESPQERVRYGLMLCVSRTPFPGEVEPLVRFYRSAVAEFRNDPEDAMKVATEPIGPVPEGVDVAELAAWTMVGNVLLNLDEMFQPR